MKPDMLSIQKPEKEKKTKAAPPKSRAMQEAAADGLIAGLPGSLASALDALSDIKRRAELIDLSSGILTQSRAALIKSIGEQASAWLPELAKMRKDVDGLISGMRKREEVEL